MTMKQNFSDYSDNNSAEMLLDPAIQKLIAPDVDGKVEVEFDGYGTLHVLKRDEYGALVSDSCLKKQDEESVSNMVNDATNMEKLEAIAEKNKTLRTCLAIQKVFIIFFTIFIIFIFILLQLTLRNYT